MKILIADDHIVVRKGLRQIILDEFPFAEIEEVGDAEELIKKVMKSKWDIVISDLSMPGRSGLDSLVQIKESFPELPVLILSVYPEEQYGVRVLKAGASGYLTKDSAPDELIKAMRLVMLGKKYITPAVAEKLVSILNHSQERQLHEQLSDREFEVLKLLATGKTITAIASQLSLGMTTVSTYRARILDKMNMNNNAELVHYAIENKLL
ncbi:MAG: response regulator transcription factor [Parafilimonas sp.]